MVEIKYVGWDELQVDDVDILQTKDLVAKHAEKLERHVHNRLELVIHVKETDRAGERKLYFISARATFPGGTIVSDRSQDWTFSKAVHGALIALEEQFEKRFTR